MIIIIMTVPYLVLVTTTTTTTITTTTTTTTRTAQYIIFIIWFITPTLYCIFHVDNILRDAFTVIFRKLNVIIVTDFPCFFNLSLMVTGGGWTQKLLNTTPTH